ncbi:unnamed protein product [Amoebophrya sp. A25]|nr:unnamed protein product [Amoebophrya sp. A25]|eukprot:GSA25T00019395001.1
MKRIFGNVVDTKSNEPRRKEEPAPTLAATSNQMDRRVQELDRRIKECDEEIVQLMKGNTGNRTGGSTLAKQKALQIMKRKKMLEQQQQQLMATQLNVEGMSLQHENMVMTANTVKAMEGSLEQMKKLTDATKGGLDPDRVADLFDDLGDMQMDVEEINEMMGRNYALDGVDDEALDAEFEALEEEIRMEQITASNTAAVPSYLPAEASATATASTSPARGQQAAADSYTGGGGGYPQMETNLGKSGYPF